jgi:hypothetical protein
MPGKWKYWAPSTHLSTETLPSLNLLERTMNGGRV